MPAITGTEGNDSLTGTAGDDTIEGLGGNDSVSASDGNDTIYGGAGLDTLRGQNGNDIIYGGDGNDNIYGGRGADLVDGGAGDDRLYNTAEDLTAGDQLVGGDGFDTLDFYGDTIVDISGLTLAADVEAIYSSSTWFRLTSDQFNQLLSVSGPCEVVGTANLDLTGNRYKNSILKLGSGNDYVTLAGNTPTGSYTVWSSAGDDTIIGSEGNDSLDGGDGNDTIEGRGGNDSIIGGAGNDNMSGGDGNDTFFKGYGTDIMDGGAGDDYFWVSIAEGFGEEDKVVGGAGVDILDIEQNGIYQGWQDFSQYDVSGIEIFRGGNASFIMSVADIAQFQSFQAGQLQLSTAGIVTFGSSFSVNDFFLSEFGNTVDISAGGNQEFRVTGGAGNDTVIGGGGNDELRGNGGNDELHGGANSDTLIGGAGVDWLDGGSGNDYFYILGGETLSAGDRFTGGTGTDNLLVGYDPDGGGDTTGTIFDLSAAIIDAGMENLQGNAVRLAVAQVASFGFIGVQDLYLANGGTVDFSNITYSGNLHLSDAGNHVTASNVISNWGINAFGGAGNDTVIGSSQAVHDELRGNGGNDTLFGGGGDDLLDGGTGADAMDGGTGNDSYFVDNAGDTVSEAAGGGYDSVQSSVSFTLGAGIEDLGLAGSASINATGNALDNRLGGNSGNNILNGGAGADTMVGGNGNDTYIVDNSNDIVDEWGADGTDQVNSSASFTLNFYVENLTLTGTAAINGTGSDWANTIQGNSNANVLSGQGGADSLLGGDGNDTLSGGWDNDSLSGQNGDDSLDGGDGDDTLDGGAGSDTANYDSANFGVSVSLAIAGAQNTGVAGGPGGGIDTLTSIENLYGSKSGDVLTGNAGANVLNGQDGNDTLEGGAGNDVVDGGNGTDNASYANAGSAVTVSLALTGSQNTGGAGSDTLANIENLVGSGFADTLTGNSGANWLLGGAGDDTLDGGDGADTLVGDAGNDTLKGGAGADTAHYASGVSGVTVNLAVLTAQNTGGAGTDTLSGVENLIGSNHADTLTGDANANILEGGLGNDTLNGGAGTDTANYWTSGSAVTVNLGLATAQNTVGAGTDTISNIENLIGSTFNDTLTGDANANEIEGFAGNDVINGGAGIDTASYKLANAGVTVTLSLVGAQNTGGAGSDTLSNIENLTGSAFNDTLTGDGGANALLGNGGDDYLMGGAGADSLAGGSGDDIFQGTKSELNGDTIADLQIGDTIIITDASLAGFTFSLTGNTLTYSGGTMTLQGPLQGNLVASAAAGGGVQLTLQAGPTEGDDTLTGTELADVINGLGGNDTIYGLGGDDHLHGAEGNDTLDGGDGDDILHGTSGDDQLLGGNGLDYLVGSSGSDTLYGGNDNDEQIGDDGNDWIYGEAGDDRLWGNLGNDTIDGGAGNDTIYGDDALSDDGDGDDQLSGGDGEDVIRGGGGNDTINGGANSDQLYGGAGADHIEGGDGDDILNGFGEEIYGSDAGADVLLGGGGNDGLSGGDGNDTLDGGAGDDGLMGGAGDDLLDGGGNGAFGDFADYQLVSGASGVTVDLSITGPQFISAAAGTDTLVNIENVTGSNFADKLTGNAGVNRLFGNLDSDVLNGAGGIDYLDGGDHNDIYIIASAAEHTAAEIHDSGISGGFWDAFDEVRFATTSAETLKLYAGDTGLEYVYVGTGTGPGVDTSGTVAANIDASLVLNALTISGNEGANILKGTAFHDMLNGNGGADKLYGNAGDDWLNGGAGDDYLYGLVGNDTLIGGAGYDRMYGGTGDDRYQVDDSTDYAYENAGEGTDRVVSSINSHTLRANVEELELTGAAVTGKGNELGNLIIGNELNNKLYGLAGSDTLEGNGGGDTLDGGLGADVMAGGEGNDQYYVDDAGDTTIEEMDSGIDTVRTTINIAMAANIENLVLLGSANLDATGNDLNNVMNGNAGDNHFVGGAGVDQLKGLDGNDTLDGGIGSDRLYGGTGDDTYIVDTTGDLIFENADEGIDTVLATGTYVLAANVENLEISGSNSANGTGNDLGNQISGNAGANILTGNGGDDLLDGGAGADVLKGGTGNDTLDGGSGRDRFYGEDGADSFIFTDGDLAGLTSSTCDQIHDFSQLQGDKIGLAGIDANTLLGGDQGFSFLGSGAFTGTAGELRYYQASGQTYVQGDTNGDGVGDFLIRLDGLHTLNVGDFII